MEQESGSLFQPGCRGDKPKERQRQDDEAERRKPEQVDREPEGRAPEGIQHEGEGGELRGNGTAEGQPEKLMAARMGEIPPCRALSGEKENGPSFQSLLSHGEQSAMPATAEKESCTPRS